MGALHQGLKGEKKAIILSVKHIIGLHSVTAGVPQVDDHFYFIRQPGF